MRQSRVPALVVGFLLCLAACSGSSPAAQSKGSLRIGVDLPLSGPEGLAGTQALDGIRFFVQQHPAVAGFDLALSIDDDAQAAGPDPQAGATDVQRFIADPALVAMIGPVDASVARAEIPIANAAGLAMVSPATTSPCLTKDVYLPAGLSPDGAAISCHDAGFPSASELRPAHVNNFFRLSTTDDLQGPAAADYAYGTLHLLRVAVVSDHEAYGQALADAFAARFVKLGGSVVGRLDLDPKSNPDVTAFFNRVKTDGARAVYFGGPTSSGACALRQQMQGVFDAGLATPFLGGDGIAEDPACIQAAGANATGIYATVAAVDATSRPGAAGTIAAFKASFGNTADYGPLTMAGYDAAGVLYAAVERAVKAAGGVRPPRGNVVSQLSVTEGFEGATGTIGFDPAGDTTNRMVSIYESPGPEPSLPWRLVDVVDYSGTLPF